MRTGQCYWRFKGTLPYRYGYATHIKGNLYRMGLWNRDDSHGSIVDYHDIEVQ